MYLAGRDVFSRDVLAGVQSVDGGYIELAGGEFIWQGWGPLVRVYL